MMGLVAAHPLVHINATLNTLATGLLLYGFYLILQRREIAHRRVMLTAFAVSVLFLACYLYYHSVVQLQTEFTHPGPVRYLYYAVLLTHVLLAMTVPFLAVYTISLGMRAHRLWIPARLRYAPLAEQQAYARQCRERHIWWARVTFPIWLYVSVTGVAVYLMLYHVWPPA